MPLIRKQQAGSDSYGHTWPEDGAVVEVEPEHAAELVAIPDGGFSEVVPDTGAEGDPEQPGEPVSDGEKEISEVDPAAPDGEPESKAPAKKTTARKTTTSKPE